MYFISYSLIASIVRPDLGGIGRAYMKNNMKERILKKRQRGIIKTIAAFNDKIFLFQN